MAKYDIKKAEEATKLDQSDLTDSEKREFEKIMNIGTANLTDSDHEKVYMLFHLFNLKSFLNVLLLKFRVILSMIAILLFFCTILSWRN